MTVRPIDLPPGSPTALKGLAAFINEARPADCDLIGAAMNDWLEGYVYAAVSEFSRNGADSRRFHVKRASREGERWSHAEIKFLDCAWPSQLPVAVICALLARSERGVRLAAHTLGLKRSEKVAAHA
jgi:hypothetical protein